MGILFSRVFQALFGSKEVRILILGLDNAGKTTILCALRCTAHGYSDLNRIQPVSEMVLNLNVKQI